ncbi:hypothetical protein H0E87_027339 [Populus deltoides]|uniref:peptidylprolyl isomerase n=1 Tax=Populus deltoides TaxID=3696 RepID=A0A8T2X1J0_POPDE|nr:hypothetical protein H0E87_027339 [Populus deltoides]
MEHLSLNPSLQNEIENENLGLPEKDVGSQGLRRKSLSRREFHGRLLHFLEMKWKSFNKKAYMRFSGVESFLFQFISVDILKDEGVATMKDGERASFTIPLNLAYGEAGSPLLIPPNATLFFYVGILSWSSIWDLTEKYEAKLENGILVSKSEEGVEFHIGDGYVCPALSKAVKTMKKGEKAELAYFSNNYICGPYHYRTSEQRFRQSHYDYEERRTCRSDRGYRIPPWRNNRSGKLEASEGKKLDGNVLFKAGKFWRASKKYEKAAKSRELNHSFTDEEMWLAKSSRLSCNLNDAACKLKLGEYLEASIS